MTTRNFRFRFLSRIAKKQKFSNSHIYLVLYAYIKNRKLLRQVLKI